jgi:hypothetical protein
MEQDKKNPKEASNIFHSIMKASVTPDKFVSAKSGPEYPECDAESQVISKSENSKCIT